MKAYRIALATVALACMGSQNAPPESEQHSFKTLAQCKAAYQRERALGMDANAQLTKARALSSEEARLIALQSEHFRRASQIDSICAQMMRAEKPLAEQVKQLTGMLDSLGPTGGSISMPIQGAIRQRNLKRVGDETQSLAGTLDAALAEFDAASFRSGSPPPPLALRPALGPGATAELDKGMKQWREDQAERARLAEIRRVERERAAAIQQREQYALAEQERQRKKSSFWDTLGVIASVGLGVAAGLEGGATAETVRNAALANALANNATAAPSLPRTTSGGQTDSSLDAQCPGLMTRLQAIGQEDASGGICQGLDATLRYSRRYEAALTMCSHPYALQSLGDVRKTIESTLTAKQSSRCP